MSQTGARFVMTWLQRPWGGVKVESGISPRMLRAWRIFALGWTFMLVPTLFITLRLNYPPGRLIPGVATVIVIAVLYLGLTMPGPATEPDSPMRFPGAMADSRVLTLASMAALVLVLSLVLPAIGGWWLMMFPIIAAGLVLPVRPATSAMGVMLGVALLASQLIAGRFEVLLLAQAAVAGGALAVRQLTVTLAQLEIARAELAHRAVDQERLRIARDLHDLLGRTLSVIVLKSELATRRLPESPALAADEMRDIERAGREALHHVRGVVSGYRTLTVATELAIARELLAAQGITAVISDDATPLPPAVDALLAWAVREGVTNVMRHSRASRCTIDIRRAGTLARISVVDDGRGEASNCHTPGHGLAGLRERAEAHGGRLCSESRGGYRLTMEVPLPRERSDHTVGPAEDH